LFSFTVEKEEVTESMFATLPLKDNEIILVTFTVSYLVEKDIRGRVTEQLELASLTDIKGKKMKKAHDGTVLEVDHRESSESEVDITAEIAGDLRKVTNGETNGSTECFQLDLKFDYVRKDRQNRCYIVDYADGKVIM
jgi:fructose 1,6-bisphosphatase